MLQRQAQEQLQRKRGLVVSFNIGPSNGLFAWIHHPRLSRVLSGVKGKTDVAFPQLPI
jgi:hypothetical protein